MKTRVDCLSRRPRNRPPCFAQTPFWENPSDLWKDRHNHVKTAHPDVMEFLDKKREGITLPELERAKNTPHAPPDFKMPTELPEPMRPEDCENPADHMAPAPAAATPPAAPEADAGEQEKSSDK